MKKKLSFLLVALLGVVGISMATFRAGTTETLYSWESPDGTPVESGGTAAYVNGDGERLNYQNAGYYTMCLNGKKANIGEAASANAGAIQITLEKPLAAGDKISITGYINKNATGKAASAYILYSNDANQTSENFGDEANIDPVANGAITTKEVIVSEEAAGSTSFKMTRSKADTNLFITKLTITREVEEAAGPENLYIIGTDNGWSRTNIPAMTWNEETQAFEYSVTATETYYFAICDVASVEEGTDTDWAIFNANNRYAIGEGDLDATIDQATQLQKVNGTVKLPAGSYKVSVTKDLVMTITSTVELNHYNALFENTANWEEVYAYTWSQDEGGNVTAQELGEWPGKKIEPESGNYVVDIQAAAAPQFIIFHNNDGTQTEDLAFEHGKTYKYEAPAPIGENDIVINADDIIEGDITAALTAAVEGKETVGNITINLAENGNYIISAPLIAYKNFEIQGNGATIDASGLEGNFIMMAATAEVPAEAVQIENVSIHNATVKGLKKALFYSTQKGYLINWLTIDNSVIELAANVTTIDFTKGSAARSFNIENSTIYAPTATTNSFYSSQAGQKLTELDAEGIQTFIVKNSTMYNLAKGKNFFTHRQSNQNWLAYDVENSLFVNCGKSGQVIKGMNGGQSGTNPTWTITGNAFNFEADGVMTDTSAAEDTGDSTEGEGVQNSVAGVVTFTDAAAGDFSGVMTVTDGSVMLQKIGDPRWFVMYNYPDEPLANPEKLYIIGDITPNGWAKTGLAEMNFDETTQTFTYEFETTLSRACFAIADVAEFTDWADFNFYHRYAYEQQGGDQIAKFNEATQLTKTKGEGTIELSDGKYTISISKADGKMTITGEATPYTVAGAFSVDGVEEESFFGTKWDPTLTANDMTILPDYTYQKVYTDVKFEKAGTILYKVCKNHAWTVCYGDGEGNNATCTVSEPCTATVTFTFNPYAEGQKVSCELSDVVGISSVKTVDLNDAPVFNLNGQRVNKAQKGLFIVGGKKVVLK